MSLPEETFAAADPEDKGARQKENPWKTIFD
jgi:hypothetical protein